APPPPPPVVSGASPARGTLRSQRSRQQHALGNPPSARNPAPAAGRGPEGREAAGAMMSAGKALLKIGSDEAIAAILTEGTAPPPLLTPQTPFNPPPDPFCPPRPPLPLFNLSPPPLGALFPQTPLPGCPLSPPPSFATLGLPRPPRGRGLWVVGGAFIQVGLVIGGVRAMGFCLRPIGGAFEVPTWAVAWLGSAPMAALQLWGPLGSALSSRFGPRPVAMAGGLLAALGLFLGAFSTRLLHLYLSVGLLAGLGWALVFTPCLGTVGCCFPSRWALATGLVVSGSSVSGMAFGLLLPLLLDSYGWRGALLLLAAISSHLVAAGALLRPGPPPPPPGPSPPPPSLPLLHHLPFLRYSLTFLLVDAGYFVPFTHGEAQAHQLGLDAHQAGILMATMAAMDGVGRLASGFLASQGGGRGGGGGGDGGGGGGGGGGSTSSSSSLLRHLFAWTSLSGLTLLLLPLGTSFGGLLALAFLYGFCSGAVVPLQFAAVAEVVGPGRVLQAIGFMQMVESLGSLLGPPLAGWLRDTTGNFTASFLTAGAFLLAGSLLLLTLPGFFPLSRAAGGQRRSQLDS
ncbi:monocarboxylate transporter 13, partial [Melanerpes formicivorus]|uniref:monocarboxylate transporter 13 n=1 Tax=Melanerpes formicivorus TaxID=211600 RepID=UPI00358E46D4